MTVQKRKVADSRTPIIDEVIPGETFSIEDLPPHLRQAMEEALAEGQTWPTMEEVELQDSEYVEPEPEDYISDVPEQQPETDLADYRLEILGKAAHAVTRDRNVAYGAPENTFATIAALWNAYLGGENLLTTDVAAMLALLKIARLATNPVHEDSWIDLAGYAACGASNAKALVESQPQDE